MKRRAVLLVLLGVIGVSCSGPLVKLALEAGANPVTIACLRMALSSLAISLPAARRGELAQVCRGPRRVFGLATLAAFLLALHYVAWMTSLRTTSTFSSVALVSTQPLFVALFSGLVLKEPTPRAALPGATLAVLAAIGIGLFSVSGEGASIVGDLLALSAAVTMAGHWLCGRAARRTVPALGYMVLVYGLTALMLAAMMPMLGGFCAPWASLPYIGLLIAMCTLGGHALFTYALGFVNADVVSFALLGEPVGAGLLALLFFGERVSLAMAVCGCLVVVGLAAYLRGVQRAARKQAMAAREEY